MEKHCTMPFAEGNKTLKRCAGQVQSVTENVTEVQFTNALDLGKLL